MRNAVRALMEELRKNGGFLDKNHVRATPERVVKAYQELLSGTYQDPSSVLSSFETDHYDQMILIRDIDFVSLCCHHLLPFYGKVHFGYIPRDKIVGVSKVPRMVEILSRRAQIQENLTQQIVQTFQSVVNPVGCGAVVEAWHACVAIRGVRKSDAFMQTAALAGKFHDPGVKSEFFEAIARRNK